MDWMALDWTLALMLIGTSVISSVLACLVLLMGRGSTTHNAAPGLFTATEDETVFLFDGREMIDATDPARALLAASGVKGTAWAQLMGCLGAHFSDIQNRLSDLPDAGQRVLTSEGPRALELRAEWRDGLARLTLLDPEADGQVVTLDALSYRATGQELETLRAVMDHAPVLAWREDAAGGVIWANRAYLLHAARIAGDDLGWPLPALFAPVRTKEAAQRIQFLAPTSPAEGWYDCHVVPLGQERLCFALPADAAVQAEASVRSFMQTLGKTFATIPIGLAIFDRFRRLQLFNPALTDLTTLGPEFLAARPTLAAFLDQLRNRQMLPEPRDYKSWRQQFEADGIPEQYDETWTLTSGQTYRVTGHPQKDGAVAFLVEDITAEITLTRRFRAELEVGQAVLDAQEEAIAVFSAAGQLTVSNAAYTRIWGVDPGASLAPVGLAEAVRHWQDRCLPDPMLSGIPSRVSERRNWSGKVMLRDGRLMRCRVVPLAGGGAMVGFSATAGAQSGLREFDLLDIPA